MCIVVVRYDVFFCSFVKIETWKTKIEILFWKVYHTKTIMDYKTLYEQSQVKISQLEQERVWYKMELQRLEPDASTRQKAVAHKLKTRNAIIGAKIEVAKLKKENEELKKENERLERLRITFINRYGELKKIVCPDSQFQDHKSIREGCLKLKKDNEEFKSTVLYYNCLVRFYDPKCNGDNPEKEYIDEYCEELGYDDQIKERLYKDFYIDEDEEYDPEEYGHCECCGISLTEDDHHNGDGKCESCSI